MVVGVTTGDGMTATEDPTFDDNADNASEGDRPQNKRRQHGRRGTPARNGTQACGARRSMRGTDAHDAGHAATRPNKPRADTNKGVGLRQHRGGGAAWRGGVAGRVEGGTPSHGRLPAPHPCARSRTAEHGPSTVRARPTARAARATPGGRGHSAGGRGRGGGRTRAAPRPPIAPRTVGARTAHSGTWRGCVGRGGSPASGGGAATNEVWPRPRRSVAPPARVHCPGRAAEHGRAELSRDDRPVGSGAAPSCWSAEKDQRRLAASVRGVGPRVVCWARAGVGLERTRKLGCQEGTWRSVM